MGKAPASQFYWGDLRRDPEYHMMSWSARGVWIEMLCLMHFSNERGKLEGDREQIARMIGCTNGDFDNAIKEISVTKTGDVTECNNLVTIINRRMYREEKERENTRLRVQRYRSNKASNKASNANVTSMSSSSSSTSIQKKIYKRKILSDEEWMEGMKKLHPWIDWNELDRDIETWLLNNPNRKKTRRLITTFIINRQKNKPMQPVHPVTQKDSGTPSWIGDAMKEGWK